MDGVEDMNNIKTIKLNLEGEICPYTLTRTVRKVEEIKESLESGKAKLEVIYDHPPIVDNIPIEFQRRGFQVKVEKIGRGKWKTIISGSYKEL